jgi:hypothetical protein
MADERMVLEKLERMPANRGYDARKVCPSARRDLIHGIQTLPPLETEAERGERYARFARYVTRAVRRGALPAAFAGTLLRKLMPNATAPVRLVSLPDLPRITDAASYRQALEVVAAAVAGGQVTVEEARVLVSIVKATWSALRAERREAR